MLPLNDPRWRTYTGGYKLPFDVSCPLRELIDNGASAELWDVLWQQLHHQGDLGSASFASVPWLLEYARRQVELDWNVFGLIATIEMERTRFCRNNIIPDELIEGYRTALDELPAVVGAHPHRTWSMLLTQCVMACIAFARGQRLLARTYLELDKDAAANWFKNVQGVDDQECREWCEE